MCFSFTNSFHFLAFVPIAATNCSCVVWHISKTITEFKEMWKETQKLQFFGHKRNKRQLLDGYVRVVGFRLLTKVTALFIEVSGN